MSRPPRTQATDLSRVAGDLLDQRQVWVLDDGTTHASLYLGSEDEIRADLLAWCGLDAWPDTWTLFRVEVRP